MRRPHLFVHWPEQMFLVDAAIVDALEPTQEQRETLNELADEIIAVCRRDLIRPSYGMPDEPLSETLKDLSFAQRVELTALVLRNLHKTRDVLAVSCGDRDLYELSVSPH